MIATVADNRNVAYEGVTLPTGEVISCSEDSADKHAYKNAEKVYMIESSLIKIPLLMTVDKELFNRIKTGALQVYEKMYSIVKSNSSLFGPKEMFDNANKTPETVNVLKQIESEGVVLTPVEAFFAAATRYHAGLHFSGIEDWAEIAKKHTKVFDSMTFDSHDKISAMLNPWCSRLGWENYFIVLGGGFGSDEFRYFEKEGGDFNMFKKYLTAFWSDTTDLSITFDECALASLPSRGDFRNAQFEQFTELPFHMKEFLEAIGPIQVEKLREIAHEIPNHSSSEVVMGVFYKILEESRTKESPEISQICLDLWFKLTHSIQGELLPPYEMGRLSSSVMMNVSGRSGYRAILEEVLSLPGYFSNLSDAETFDIILSQNSSSWIVESIFYGDYTLLKLCEKVGAVQTVEMIADILEDENNSALTYDQWMELADRYDELKDSPASWWSSLLR